MKNNSVKKLVVFIKTLVVIGIILVVIGTIYFVIDFIGSQNKYISYYETFYEEDISINIDLRLNQSENPQNRLFSRVYFFYLPDQNENLNFDCYVIAIQDISNTLIIYDSDGVGTRYSIPSDLDSNNEFYSIRPLEVTYSDFLDKYCVNDETQSTPYNFFEHKIPHSVKATSEFFYPFDSMVFRSIFWIAPVYEGDNEILTEKIIPKINLQILTNEEWTIDYEVNEKDSEIDKGKEITIIFSRPNIYKFSFIFFIVFLVCSSIYVNTIRQTDLYIQAVFTLFFGIWGIRTVLIPDYITQRTILDIILLFIYFICIVGGLLRLLFINKKFQKNRLFSYKKVSFQERNKIKKQNLRRK